MAVRIPDSTGISRYIGSTEKSVSVERNAGVVGAALQDVAAGGQNLLDSYERAEVARGNYELERARNDLFIARQELQTEFAEDRGYDDLPTRYSERYNERVDGITKRLSSDRARRAFNEDVRTASAEDQTRMVAKARAIEIDTERANIFTSLEQLREAGLSSDEAMVGASDRIDGLFDAAVESGYYDAEQAAKAKLAAKTDLAVGRVEMLEPEQQISALNQEWAKNIPADVRAQLKRAAGEKLRADRAVNHVDEYMRLGLSEADALDRASKIGNEAQRRETERRVQNAYAARRAAEAEEVFTLYSGYHDGIMQGTLTYSQIAAADRMNMTPQQRESLKRLEADKAAGKSGHAKNSDPRILRTLHDLTALEDWTGLREYMNQIDPGRLTRADFGKFTERASKALVGPEFDSELTFMQAVTSKMDQYGVAEKREQEIIGAMDRWRINYQEINNGRVPNDKERNEKLDALMMERERPRSGLWSLVDSTESFNIVEDAESAVEAGSTITLEDIKRSDPQGYSKFATGATPEQRVETYKAQIQAIRQLQRLRPEIYQAIQRETGVDATPIEQYQYYIEESNRQ